MEFKLIFVGIWSFIKYLAITLWAFITSPVTIILVLLILAVLIWIFPKKSQGVVTWIGGLFRKKS